MEPGEPVFIGGKKFTYREFQLICYSVQGFLRKQMAAALGKSLKTIDSQFLALYRKLDIHKETELVA